MRLFFFFPVLFMKTNMETHSGRSFTLQQCCRMCAWWRNYILRRGVWCEAEDPRARTGWGRTKSGQRRDQAGKAVIILEKPFLVECAQGTILSAVHPHAPCRTEQRSKRWVEKLKLVRLGTPPGPPASRHPLVLRPDHSAHV